MRVVWRDSSAQSFNAIKYRKHYITRHNGGWVTDFPNDNNIYKSHYCAQNALDKHLGGYGVRGKPTEKRLRCGIEIIGQKEKG